jgi:hypothetical protein
MGVAQLLIDVEITRLLWNWQVHSLIRNSRLMDPNLSQINPLHTLKLHLL